MKLKDMMLSTKTSVYFHLLVKAKTAGLVDAVLVENSVHKKLGRQKRPWEAK